MQELQLIKSEQFGTAQADIYSNGKEMFMTANQLGECLEYSEPTIAINKLVSRNEYLKNVEFSTLTSLVSLDGKQREVRVFTEDGIYEITMLSKTPKAKQFRAWVRKILKSLRSGQATLIDTKRLEAIKVNAQQDRAKAMLLNAQNRALKTLMSALPNDKLSPIAVEVFGLKSIEQVTGINMGNYLPQCDKTYSATEVGNMLGISANKVGKIANANGLKTDEYGVSVMDKSKYSAKEIPNFRYNQKGLEAIRQALQG